MKILYFDCFSGISGDMILGALSDLGLDINFLKKELLKLNIGNCKIEAKKVIRKGITATKVDITDSSKHHHERNIKEIFLIIDNSKLEIGIKNKIKKIFLRIADAESKVHNTTIDKVHFHEIGAIDTIIDVSGAIIGLEKLGIKRIFCSKLNLGAGFVEFSHGKFPVPAPATAEILKGIPVYHNNVMAELVTPTGAAIIREMAYDFGEMPDMVVEKIGYGAGTKDLVHPNVLRVYSGRSVSLYDKDIINVIETNIDDMDLQLAEPAIKRLMENGALDAFVSNILMKKSRRGFLLTVLCRIEDAKKLEEVIFDETTTIGLRIYQVKREKLRREIKSIKTKYGPIRIKISKFGTEVKNIKPEFEDCKKSSEKFKVPLREVYREVNELYTS